MELNISKEWLENAADLEEGCSVSAGSPIAFERSMEIHDAMLHAVEQDREFVVFHVADDFRRPPGFGHMWLSEWLRGLLYGAWDAEGYTFVAKVTPTGNVDFEKVTLSKP